MSFLNIYQKDFFRVEIDNEADGGDSPATLQSALDSLKQAPPDTIVEWCNYYEQDEQNRFAKEFTASIEDLIARFENDTELEHLLSLDEGSCGIEFRHRKTKCPFCGSDKVQSSKHPHQGFNESCKSCKRQWTALGVRESINELIANQGWTEATIGKLAFEFLFTMKVEDKFLAHLEETAEIENS